MGNLFGNIFCSCLIDLVINVSFISLFAFIEQGVLKVRLMRSIKCVASMIFTEYTFSFCIYQKKEVNFNSFTKIIFNLWMEKHIMRFPVSPDFRVTL